MIHPTIARESAAVRVTCRTCEGRGGWSGSGQRIGRRSDVSTWHTCVYCDGTGLEDQPSQTPEPPRAA